MPFQRPADSGDRCMSSMARDQSIIAGSLRGGTLTESRSVLAHGAILPSSKPGISIISQEPPLPWNIGDLSRSPVAVLPPTQPLVLPLVRKGWRGAPVDWTYIWGVEPRRYGGSEQPSGHRSGRCRRTLIFRATDVLDSVFATVIVMGARLSCGSAEALLAAMEAKRTSPELVVPR